MAQKEYERERRVAVIVNKWWECVPILDTLLNSNAYPAELGWPSFLNHPRKRQTAKDHTLREWAIPRAIFNMRYVSAEIWCISDLLEHLPQKSEFQSSSERKAEVLPVIFNPVPNLVVAVGTAAYPGEQSENGNVVIGTRIFIHNGHPNGENHDSNWTIDQFDCLLDSPLSKEQFGAATTVDSNEIIKRFLVPPLNPASEPRLIVGYKHIGIGVANVTDYSEYEDKDQEALRAFYNLNDKSHAQSLETTHGVIRVQCNKPFLFISGITDRVGHFAEEVGPRTYAQNTAAAHNAGIALAWLLPNIDRILAE